MTYHGISKKYGIPMNITVSYITAMCSILYISISHVIVNAQ